MSRHLGLRRKKVKKVGKPVKIMTIPCYQHSSALCNPSLSYIPKPLYSPFSNHISGVFLFV